MDTDFLKEFALDSTGVSVLVTMQHDLVLRDIESTSKLETKSLKRTWLREWETVVEQGFGKMMSQDSQDRPVFLVPSDLREKCALLREDKTQAGLILLELVTFAPYFPFKTDQIKKFKGLKLDSNHAETLLEKRAQDLGFSSNRANELRNALSSTMNSMTGKWRKIGFGVLAGLGLSALTMGLAAPFIGGLVGAAMGLSGAAATAAGLAAIGGGAIAAGGFGMAGGVFILVGGGALLGLGAGGAGGYWVSAMNSGTALVQAVKLEVSLKEFILQGQYDKAKAQEILFRQRNAIQEMEKEIDRLRMNGDEDEKRIKDLEDALNILNKALKRNQDIVREAA